MDSPFQDLPIKSSIHAKHDAIIRQGSNPGNIMFFLIQGELEVIKKIGGIDEAVEVLHAGSFFGELGLVDRRPRTASVRVISDFAKVAILDQEVFLLIAKNKPDFLLKLWKKITNWILETEDRLELTQKQLSDLKSIVVSTPDPEPPTITTPEPPPPENPETSSSDTASPEADIT